MHCREFRNKHVAFVDDLLPAVEMDAMRRHLDVCSGCCASGHTDSAEPAARPEPSVDRNVARIHVAAERAPRRSSSPSRATTTFARAARLTSAVSFAALAAGLVAVAYLAVETNRYFGHPGEMSGRGFADDRRHNESMQIDPSPITNAALVASVPTGIPVWPAVLMVGQSPMRFASLEFNDDTPAR